MTQEEKAKRYDESRERMKDFLKEWENCGALGEAMEKAKAVFPELRESEDERIRKHLLEYFNSFTSDTFHNGIPVKETLAWLEKQCENKPTDKKGMNLVENEMTPFQKKVFCIIDTTIEEEHGLKQVCDELLRLAHDEIKQKTAEWSEEDKNVVEDIEEAVINNWFGDTQYIILDWLKTLKERVQLQNTWKPSDEQVKALEIAQKYVPLLEGSVLDSLYNELKNLK